MAFVHYKFFSQVSFKTLVFHRSQVTLSELKREIMSREKLHGRNSDLQVTDEQSKTGNEGDICTALLRPSQQIRLNQSISQ
uniref:DWNN domain-containing protein n=1 Tax=Salarias fasciatus TaxID=181472 RepID=A0A672J568_SALFA